MIVIQKSCGDPGTYQQERISIKQTIQRDKHPTSIASGSAGRNKSQEDQKTGTTSPYVKSIQKKGFKRSAVYTTSAKYLEVAQPYVDFVAKSNLIWRKNLHQEWCAFIHCNCGKDETSQPQEEHCKVVIRSATMKSDMTDHVCGMK